MILVIAEKPILGKQIADAIDPKTPSKVVDGVITKGEYTIIWAFGHLLTLKMPEDYDGALAKWQLSTLPIYFPNWEVKPKPQEKNSDGSAHGMSAEARLKQIGALIKKADIIYHAGDPDEEGQLLIDEILRYYDCKKPVYRLATGDTTQSALQKALKEVKNRPNRNFINDGWSAYARSVADLTFGINVSRYFSLNNPDVSTLTVGRVQSPTLGLVVMRDQQIESHVKVEYFTVSADLDINGTVVPCKYEPNKDDPNLTDGKILDETYAKNKQAMLDNEVFDNVKIADKSVSEAPPLPLNLVELSTQCGNRYHYSPSKVLEITQRLREKWNAITYNRSECRYLSDAQYAEAPQTMRTVIQNLNYKPKQLDMTLKSKAFDSSKTEKAAHTAIIPQDTRLNLSAMAEDEKNVYTVIAQYYMAQFLPPAKKLRKRLEVLLQDGGKLTSTSTEVAEKGYLAIFPQAEKDTTTALSTLAAGTYRGEVVSTKTERKETKPPARYTQTSLNKDMTGISKYVKDANIKKLLLEKDKDVEGDNGAIGTPATRAGIIQGLINRGFLEEKDGKLISTALGRELIRVLPDEAKKPDLTALWWNTQQDIRSGAASYEKLTLEVLDTCKSIISTTYPKIDTTKVPKKKGRMTRKVLGTCPWCGKPVVEGKLGFGCMGWKDGCKFTIWKKSKSPLFKNITFTETNAIALLSGKSIAKKGLVKKDGTTFDARLSLRKGPPSPWGAEFDLSFPPKKNKK